MFSLEPVIKLFEEICELEMEVLVKHEISGDEAKILHNRLISFNVKFIKYQVQITTECKIYQDNVDLRELNVELNFCNSMQQKITNLETKLKKFFEPSVDPSTGSKLNSFIQKQKFLIEMTSSLEASDDISKAEAEVRYNNLISLHQLFISNQMEILTHVNGAGLEDQIKLSKEIQQKVISLQTKLKENLSSKEPTFPTELKASDLDQSTRNRNVQSASNTVADSQTNFLRLKLKLSSDRANSSNGNNSEFKTTAVNESITTTDGTSSKEIEVGDRSESDESLNGYVQSKLIAILRILDVLMETAVQKRDNKMRGLELFPDYIHVLEKEFNTTYQKVFRLEIADCELNIDDSDARRQHKQLANEIREKLCHVKSKSLSWLGD